MISIDVKLLLYSMLELCYVFKVYFSDQFWHNDNVISIVFAIPLMKLYIFFLQTIHKIRFGQIYLSKPMITESDGEMATLFPKAARLRNLTYSAPLCVDVSKRVIKKGHDGVEVTETQDFTQVFIGKVRELLFMWKVIKATSAMRF